MSDTGSNEAGADVVNETGGQQPDGSVQEPDNSTVDDWFGQNVARDQEVADQVSEQSDDPDEAEAKFEEQASGEERYEEGHPRPEESS